MSNDPEQIGEDERAERVRKAGEELSREELNSWHLERGLIALDANEKPKPVEWMCHGIFDFDTASVISAKPKAGKSSMVQAIAIGLASGKGAVKSLDGGWIFDSKGQRIKTLYIDTENSRSLVLRRLTSLAKEIGEDLSELISSGYLTVLPLQGSHAAPFLKHKDREGLEDDIEQASSYGEMAKRNGYRLIICDVMSDCYQQENSGRDELSQGFMSDFFKIIGALKQSLQAHVMLVHHHKKGDGTGNEQASGSSQMNRKVGSSVSISKVPEEKNPDGDLYVMELIAREGASGTRYIWIKAGSSADGACRVFTEVPQPVKEKKAKGAPATADKIAREILAGVLLKAPELRGREITPVEWVSHVYRVKDSEPEWLRSDETYKDYLRNVLTKAGLVERGNTNGLYRIL